MENFEKFMLKPGIKKLCTTNKTLLRCLEDYFHCHFTTVYRRLQRNDDKFTSTACLKIISSNLKISESELVVPLNTEDDNDS